MNSAQTPRYTVRPTRDDGRLDWTLSDVEAGRVTWRLWTTSTQQPDRANYATLAAAMQAAWKRRR